MNRPLGKTADSGWDVKEKKMKPRRHNHSTTLRPNRVRFSHDYSNNNATNQTTIYANTNNYFFKKTRILTDMMGEDRTQAQSFTMVVVVTSIFFFCTIMLTAALIVFCKKRNSVFALQKSDQDTDPDYEMDEYNTDVEFTETDYDSEGEFHESFRLRSANDSPARQPLVSAGAYDSPARQPLVSPSDGRPVCSHATQTCDTRGNYQQIASASETRMTNDDNDSDNDGAQLRTAHWKHLNRNYYALAAVSSDGSSDQDSNGHESSKKTLQHADNGVTQQSGSAAGNNTQASRACADVPTMKDNNEQNGLHSPANVTEKDRYNDSQTKWLATSLQANDSHGWVNTTPLIHASYNNNVQPQQISSFDDILSSPLSSPLPQVSPSSLTTTSPTEVQQSTSRFTSLTANDNALSAQPRRAHTENVPPHSVVHKSRTISALFSVEHQNHGRTNSAFDASHDPAIQHRSEVSNTSMRIYSAPQQTPGAHNRRYIARSVTSPLLSSNLQVAKNDCV